MFEATMPNANQLGQIHRSALRKALQSSFADGILEILNTYKSKKKAIKYYPASWKWMLTLTCLKYSGIDDNVSGDKIRKTALNLGIHSSNSEKSLHQELFASDDFHSIDSKAIISGLESISSSSILARIPKKHREGIGDPWNEILSEDIGSCFEVVVDAKPIIENKKLILTNNDERRKGGIHHTPFDVTQRMVDISFQKKNIADNNIPDPFVICDLAVGAGAFLVQATRILMNTCQGSRSINDIILKHIVGFDIDEQSIRVANLCLHMEAGFPNQVVSYNLYCIDSVGKKSSKEFIHGKIKKMSLESRGVADITIGNPPYVQYKEDVRNNFIKLGFSTAKTNNLSAIFLEQALETTEFGGVICQIIPISIIQSAKMRPARSMLTSRSTEISIEAYDCVPGYIFDQGKIGSNSNSSITRQVAIISAVRGDHETVVNISRMIRWSSSERDKLFESIETVGLPKQYITENQFPMLGDSRALNNFKHLTQLNHKISDLFGYSRVQLFIPKAVRYFITAVPSTLGRDNEIKMKFNDIFSRNLAMIIINSSFFYWYWKVVGNGFQVNSSEVNSLPIPNIENLTIEQKKQINRMANRLSNSRSRKRLSVEKSNKGIIRNVKYDLDQNLMRDLDDLIDSIYQFPCQEYRYRAYKSNNLNDFQLIRG